MRKIGCIVFSMFMLAAQDSISVERIQTESEQIALHVVNSYFEALIVGDVAGVRKLLGGNLLKERSAMFDNPNYGSFLQNLYARASYQITQVKMVSDSAVVAQVRLYFGDGNSQDSYFLLDRQADNQYKIVSEN